VLVNINVKPGSSKIEVQKDDQGLLVYLTALPVKGMANKQLIEVLSDYYNVSKSSIDIIRGWNFHKKVVEVKNV